MTTGRALAVAGAKGGVGKTTTAINLGAALEGAGVSAVVVEADLVMANAVDFVDLEADLGATLHDVLAGDALVSRAVYEAPGGFDLVPSGTGLEGYAATDPSLLEEVVDRLRRRYDVVVLDTGAGVSTETLVPMALADRVALVSSPRLASVRDTRKTIELAERVSGTVAGVVFSKSGTGSAPPPEHIARFLEVEMLGHVPDDEAIPASQDAGLPVTEYAPAADATSAYRDIARRVRNEFGGPPTDAYRHPLAEEIDETPAHGAERDGRGGTPSTRDDPTRGGARGERSAAADGGREESTETGRRRGGSLDDAEFAFDDPAGSDRG